MCDITEKLKEQIKDEYINTDTSLKKIAQKYGVSLNYIKKYSVSEGWYVQQKARKAKRAAECTQKERTKRLIGITDSVIGILEKYLNQLEDENTVPDAQKLRQIVQSVKDMKEFKFDVSSEIGEKDAQLELISAIKKAVEADEA